MLALHCDSVTSTSDRAAAVSRLNPTRTLLVTARQQTAGRGRTGRRWASPVGGAWFTLAYPTTANPMQTEAAPLVAGLAIRQAIAAETGLVDADDRLQIKWPNDILLDGHKLAGILCERTLLPSATPDAQTRYTLLIGVGINANLRRAMLGSDLRHPATSLLEALEAPVDVAGLIGRCAVHTEAALDRLVAENFCEQDTAAANAHLAWRGMTICLQQGLDTLEGTLEGVDARGRLLLEIDGVVTSFHAGEVRQLRILPEDQPTASARRNPIPIPAGAP